jgi:AraC-like DNA-binding protein
MFHPKLVYISSMSSPEAWMVAWRSLMDASSLHRLRLGCSFVPRTEPDNWFGIADDPRRTTVVSFELSYGLERERSEYGLRGLAIARETKRTHVGERAGFADFFIPVVRAGEVCGVLVCGPVLHHVPTIASLKDAWRGITGAPADPDDEAFLRFVRCTLDSHVYEGDALRRLLRHVESMATTMAGTDSPSARMQDDLSGWLELRRAVPEAGMWDVASEIVDPEKNAQWTASYRATDRELEGIPQMPNFVVAVAPCDPERGELDATALLLRTHALQRACGTFALSLRNTVAGRIGSEAAFFLTFLDTNRPDRERSRLAALADKIDRFSKRILGTEVVCGFGERARHGAELPTRYDEALWAALWGLHKGRKISFYADAGGHDPTSAAGLYRSTRALGQSFTAGRRRETGIAAEQVVKDVLWVSDGGLEVMRSHFLEVLWELLAIAERRDALDRRVSSEMLADFSVRMRRSRTTHDVTHSFTALVRELLHAAERPGQLGRRARLERACRLVESGQGTGLDLVTVAARVGMSRSRFAAAFRETYRTSFGQFAQRARLERSKAMLRGTTLKAAEVGAEAGYSSPSYFHQAFKRMVGMTPEQYRQSIRVR